MGFLIPPAPTNFEDPPEIDDEEVQKEKRRRQVEMASGRSNTVLTGGPQAPTLGSASTLSGGLA